MTSFCLLKSQMLGTMISNHLHGLVFDPKNLRSRRDHLVSHFILQMQNQRPREVMWVAKDQTITYSQTRTRIWGSSSHASSSAPTMKGTVHACPRIPTHVWSKRRPHIVVRRKHDLFISKTSWTSLMQITLPALSWTPTCLWSVYVSILSLDSKLSHHTLHVTSLQTWVFTTILSQHAPVCLTTSGCICLQTHSLWSWDFLKWIFPSADTSLWMYHKRWHFSRAGCFWKNILDECQARLHEMSWWLSKETCQELGWVKIATAGCGCEVSKDHREKSLFVFKIIISKWFWAWRMHQTGRQESGRSVSDARERRQRRATDGKVGGENLRSQPQCSVKLRNTKIVILSFSTWSREREGEM